MHECKFVHYNFYFLLLYKYSIDSWRVLLRSVSASFFSFLFFFIQNKQRGQKEGKGRTKARKGSRREKENRGGGGGSINCLPEKEKALLYSSKRQSAEPKAFSAMSHYSQHKVKWKWIGRRGLQLKGAMRWSMKKDTTCAICWATNFICGDSQNELHHSTPWFL